MTKQKLPNFTYQITGSQAEVKLNGQYYDTIDLDALIDNWLNEELDNNWANIQKWLKKE